MTALLQDQPVVQQAYGQYQQFNRDEKMRALDEAHQRFLNDQASDIAEARFSEKIGIARNMKRKGCDVDFIIEMTGLSSAEIGRLS